MARTSNKPQEILAFVNDFMQENGFPPSVREIGAAVGLRSTASVTYHLRQMQLQGLLHSSGEKGKKRTVVSSQKPGQIPVIGVVTAGMPILAFENQEGTMAWDGDPNCFALRVKGDSMIGAGILDGDKVVVRPQNAADDGQIVVARLEDEATVKRLLRRDGKIVLMPE
ncbi:MAG: repressor LexA, partial [Oscillospiraceae bacterium]|nr:repressor LexA [Oscillospiraceae bacterium]